jgi:hypothetical integral membrane protein (TIGR02206 family)
MALGIGAVAAAILITAGRRGNSSRILATGILAFLNLSAYPLGQAAWLSMGGQKSIDHVLPFHLCDIAAITAGFALLTRKPLLCTLTYFWGLAATFQALLTPAITVGFPHWPFVMFFVHHFAVVTAALYLPLVEGWRPKAPLWRVPLEVYGCSVSYLIFAMTANHLLGSNFGFASHPPENPSLIDHLGPWPLYLFSLQGIALGCFFVLTLPFFLKRSG